MQQILKIFLQKNRLPCKNRRKAEKGETTSRMLRGQRNDMRLIPPSGGKRKNYLSPVGRTARRQAQTPADTAQAQYRTAGRVLQARSDRSVLAYVTGAASAARRVPAKRDCAVNKKMADLQGFEPRQSEPESLVLPLHHRSAYWYIIYHKKWKIQAYFQNFCYFFSTPSKIRLPIRTIVAP